MTGSRMDHTEDPTGLLDLVARRIDYLEYLEEEAGGARELVEAVGDSRSTANRALRELESAGLVGRTDDGYATTTAGALAAESVREVMERLPAIADAAEFLEPLDPDAPVDPDLLVGAEIELAEGPTPYRPRERIESVLESATRVRVLLPFLSTPRLLGHCHRRVVEEGATAEMVVSPELFEAAVEQFPGTFAEMAAADFAAFTGELPPFGLFLAEADGETTVGVAVYTGRRSVHGVLLNDSPDAVAWAEALYERVRSAAMDVTGELEALDAEAATDAGPVAPGLSNGASADALPTRLETEGFVRLSEAYFERREPAPPAVCWRAELTLAEVRAGYAVSRERCTDGGRRELTEELVGALADGDSRVLLGPPGAGKSTVCKSVACRWYDRDRGPVFYREGGNGTPFESVSLLADRLRRADGHALVVVEDAVRAEANAVFELLEEFAGDPTVSFLFDATERDWHELDEFPADARLREYANSAVETVTIPPLDERAVERFVEAFVRTLDVEIEVPVGELLAEVRTASSTDRIDDDSHRADEVLLLLHRLASYADPVAETGTTTLTEDVRRVHRLLRDRGEVALDVGVTVNLLNAAGVGVRPELLYALSEDSDAVGDALDALEGRVLFGETDGRYRTVHESWSKVFLDQFLDACDPRAAHDRVGRCLTAMLSLADDRSLRERIEWQLTGKTPYLNDIESNPGEWADEFVRRIFSLGLDYPGLGPLFGRTGYDAIEFPAVCSPVLAARCAYWRGRMYLNAGDFDAAEREFETACELVGDDGDVPEDRAATLEAKALTNLAEVAYKRREYDDATDYVERALDIRRDIGDRQGEADDLRIRGIVSWLRGDTDPAEDYFTRSLDICREIGDRHGEAKCLNNLGLTARRRGDLADAEEYLSRSLELKREVGDHVETAKTLNNLGLIARDRDALGDAEEYFLRSLEIKRRVGDRQGEANTLTNLAVVARRTDDVEGAEEYARRALEVYDAVDDPQGEADSRRVLAGVALDRDDPETATRRARESLDQYRDIDDDRGEGRALHVLARAERRRGNREEAADLLASGIELLREAGTRRDLADALFDRGVLAAADDPDAAGDYLAEAVDCYRTIGARRSAASAAERLADLYETRGDPAAERWRRTRDELAEAVPEGADETV